jgi:hypothetical protein
LKKCLATESCRIFTKVRIQIFWPFMPWSTPQTKWS